MFNRAKHAGAELSLGGREPISYMGLVSRAHGDGRSTATRAVERPTPDGNAGDW